MLEKDKCICNVLMLIYLYKKSDKHTSKHYFCIRQKKKVFGNSKQPPDYILSANECKGVTYLKWKECELLFHLYLIYGRFTPPLP